MTLNVQFQPSNKLEKAYLILDGELDAVGAPVLEQWLNKSNVNIKTLVLNMQNLSFVSSAGLRVFAKGQKLMKQRNGQLLFVNVQPQVKKVFDIVKAVNVSEIFTSYDELDAYLVSMQVDDNN